MPTIYVRSTDGSDSDDGSSWSLAKATLAGAAAVAVAGDIVKVSHVHAESTAAAATANFAGTPANPIIIMCVNDGTDALADTGTMTTTGSNAITLNGSIRVYGLTPSAGTGAGAVSLVMAAVAGQSDLQRYENCKLRLGAGGGGVSLGTTTGTATRVISWRNCQVKFNNSTQNVRVQGVDRFTWDGGGVEAGSVTPAALVAVGSNGRGGAAFLSGLDLSALSTSMVLFSAASVFAVAVARNIKLPAGVPETGWLVGALTAPGPRFEAYNIDSGDTQRRIYIEEFAGYTRDESTVVRTGGATDGATPFSWKMVSNANASRHGARVVSPEIHIPLNAAGSPITIAADIVTDGVTLTDGEAWIDVQYAGTNGFSQSVFANDAAAINGTPANQDSSTDAWTTTGLTSPTKQRLSVTVTPQEVGTLIARVVLAKASTTMFADLPRVL